MNRISATAALLACVSLCSTPAAALELPRRGPAQIHRAYDAAAETVEHRRSRYGRYRHRDNGIDAGDVIAGVLILGGIAAIAGAASESGDRSEPSSYPDDPRSRGPAPSGYQSGGMDRAVDMCVAELERGRDRVTSVDSAARSGEGWFVSGEVEDGAPFTCRIDNDGRIGDVEVGSAWSDSEADAGGDLYAPPSDTQYDDATYAEARAATSTPAGYAYGN